MEGLHRSHRSKNVTWILPELAAKGARTLDELRPATDKDAEHTVTLDNLKQLSLYTDCLGAGHWAEPERVVDRALAQTLVAIAYVLARPKTVTSTEIELWNKHMRPVRGDSPGRYEGSAAELVCRNERNSGCGTVTWPNRRGVHLRSRSRILRLHGAPGCR